MKFGAKLRNSKLFKAGTPFFVQVAWSPIIAAVQGFAACFYACSLPCVVVLKVALLLLFALIILATMQLSCHRRSYSCFHEWFFVLLLTVVSATRLVVAFFLSPLVVVRGTAAVNVTAAYN